MPDMEIIRTAVSVQHLGSLAEGLFGELVKAVVDVEGRLMAIGGDLHADEEALLLDEGWRSRTCRASTSIRTSTARPAGSSSTR